MGNESMFGRVLVEHYKAKLLREYKAPNKEKSLRSNFYANPVIVHRETVDESVDIKMEHIVAAQYEFGDQAESLKMMCKNGVDKKVINIKVQDQEYQVFCLVPKKIVASSWEDYRLVVEKMFSTGFDGHREYMHTREALSVKDGVPPPETRLSMFDLQTNGWLDFSNGIFLSLDEPVVDDFEVFLKDFLKKGAMELINRGKLSRKLAQYLHVSGSEKQ